MATPPPATPTGERFSHVYLSRGTPASDSQRFRNRLAQGFESRVKQGDYFAFARVLVSELGIDVPGILSHFNPASVFRRGDIRDVLDAITLLFTFLLRARRVQEALDWHKFVARTMREENVGYKVDEACGVHYYVDEEFEHNRAAALAVLDHTSLGNARASFDDAFRHLDSQPRDTKAAVRSMFEAAEVIAKQICPEAQNLNRRLVESTLKERCIVTMGGDSTEGRALEAMFDSLALWVNGIHNYRHGQAADEPVAPSEELAVYVLSTGSAHVRLLATCFLRLQPGGV